MTTLLSERASELKTRLAISLVITYMLLTFQSASVAALYFTAMVLSQGVDNALSGWFRRKAKSQRIPAAHFVACLISVSLSTATYNASALLLWESQFAAAKVVAIMILFGSLLHVTLQMAHVRIMTIAAVAPTLLYLILMPLHSFFITKLYGANEIIAYAVGASAFVTHIAVAFFRNEKTSRELHAARDTARQEQALAERSQQAAEWASNAKSRFLANMSHEIRTPMNAILGLADVLQRETLTDSQRERLSLISESGQTLLRILNDILDLSKVEAGKIELETLTFDLPEITNTVEAAAKLKAEEKGLAFELTVEETADGSFYGDPTRIRQVLSNLLSNAVKFTETGKVSAAVRAQDNASEDGATMLLFSVADTGSGLSPEAVATLFEPFTQADETINRRHGGTGLGLTIAKDLCALMGGDLWVESVEGAGSTFHFSVRVARAATVQDHGRAAASDEARSTFDAPLRVLVAEDNAVNQLVLKALLEQHPITLTFADNGGEALDAWRGGDFDAILMDVHMPVMNGVDATRRIRAIEADTDRAPTPIIAVTASAMRHEVEECFSVGMDGVITKPIEIGKLVAMLGRLRVDPGRRRDDQERASGAG